MAQADLRGLPNSRRAPAPEYGTSNERRAGTPLCQRFTTGNLTGTLASIEGGARGLTAVDCGAFLERAGAGHEALAAAAELKRMAGQVDVTIHALGILLCLPHILEVGETVEYVSLGAGNTGRRFDLETNVRIAEFKFIRWRGGPESMRQNATFKDFYELAAYATSKGKYLYLLGTRHAMRFFRSARAMDSVLSRNQALRQSFLGRFGERYSTVGDYFAVHGDEVEIEDMSAWLRTWRRADRCRWNARRGLLRGCGRFGNSRDLVFGD